MIKAWEWKVDDCIVNVLPLHHIHGIINCVMCPLYNGSTLIMERKFNVQRVCKIRYYRLQIIFILITR